MYPDGDLNQAALRKAALHCRIDRRRRECATILTEVTRPIEWVDRGLQRWRELSPWVKMAIVPIGLMVGRSVSTRRRAVGRMLRWIPVAAGLLRTGLALSRARAQPGAAVSAQRRALP